MRIVFLFICIISSIIPSCLAMEHSNSIYDKFTAQDWISNYLDYFHEKEGMALLNYLTYRMHLNRLYFKYHKMKNNEARKFILKSYSEKYNIYMEYEATLELSAITLTDSKKRALASSDLNKLIPTPAESPSNKFEDLFIFTEDQSTNNAQKLISACSSKYLK
jgi:hypothetical protein